MSSGLASDYDDATIIVRRGAKFVRDRTGQGLDILGAIFDDEGPELFEPVRDVGAPALDHAVGEEHEPS